jgi:hypothetical protein
MTLPRSNRAETEGEMEERGEGEGRGSYYNNFTIHGNERF